MRRHVRLPFCIALIFLVVGPLATPVRSDVEGRGFPGQWDAYEDFKNAKLPNWTKVSGTWTVRAGGVVRTGLGRSIAVSRHRALQSFRTGVVKVRTRLTSEGSINPNAAVLFSYRDSRHYRYAMVSRDARSGILTIGQVGTFGGATAGVKASKRVKLAVGEWFELDLHTYPMGEVRARVESGTSQQTLGGKFPTVQAGRVGIMARGAVSVFDRFRGFEVGGAPAGSPETARFSVRLMTYNTAMLATGDSNEDIYLMHDDDRAAKIAAGVLRADVDVVALNEVFSEEAREEFLKQLGREHFPSWVSKLYKPGVLNLNEDSGLMLFSRHPFIPLTNKTYLAKKVTARNKGLLWGEVAFRGFDYRSSWDELADKGCALVRIQHKVSGEKFTVVFTHLQASYGEDDARSEKRRVQDRQMQLLDCEAVIRGSLSAEELVNQPLFMMGDLNINGNKHSWKLPPILGGHSEWYSRFDVAGYGTGNFYACGDKADTECPGPVVNGRQSHLTDTWAYETSPDDLGRSQGNDLFLHEGNKGEGERLDYVLRNRPEGYCNQHLSGVWEAHEQGGAQAYSDHLPIRIDMNYQAPNCNPRDARPIRFCLPYNGHEICVYDVALDGTITYGGSMQWLRIDKKGTYSFAFDAFPTAPKIDNIAFEIYASTDLSRPISSYHGENSGRYGLEYLLNNPPYYVRVFARDPATGRADRNSTGNYRLRVHRHQCGSEDPCALPNGIPKLPFSDYAWPAGQPVNAQDTIWYTFYTDTGERGDHPLLKFNLLGVANASDFTLELMDGAPPYAVIPFDAPQALQNNILRAQSQSLDGAATGAKKYFLKVKRNALVGVRTTPYYLTSLTYFEPRHLKCSVQQDSYGDDEIWVAMAVDSPQSLPQKRVAPYAFFSDFDEGTSLGAANLGIRRYARSVRMGLIEEGGGLDGPDDHLSSDLYVKPLDEGAPSACATYAGWKFMDEYWYALDYCSAHDVIDLPR